MSMKFSSRLFWGHCSETWNCEFSCACTLRAKSSANKNVFSFLRTLTTWHYPLSPAAAPHAALLCALQQSIDISCLPGPLRQTCSSGYAAVGPWWDRQTGRRTDARQMHRPCSAEYEDSANNLCVSAGGLVVHHYSFIAFDISLILLMNKWTNHSTLPENEAVASAPSSKLTGRPAPLPSCFLRIARPRGTFMMTSTSTNWPSLAHCQLSSLTLNFTWPEFTCTTKPNHGLVFCSQRSPLHEIRPGSPPAGAPNAGGVSQNRWLSTNNRLYLGIGKR